MSIRVKIIGAGSIGNHLAQAARRMGWAVAVVDRDKEALSRMKEEIYPKRYGGWDDGIELFESGSEPKGGFDIICLGTPPDVRMELALSALREKPKVLQLEKPLCAPTLKGLDEFLSAYAAQTDSVAVVGYDHAISKSVAEMLSLLEQKVIGQVETIDVEFREHWAGIFAAHSWLKGPEDSYLGFWRRGGGASGEHSHALHLWQLLASRSGLGKWVQVSSAMEMQTANGADYDSIAAFSLLTDQGKVGRVVQDVVTQPPRKWARLQGDRGFIEWLANGHPKGDLLRLGVAGQPVIEKVFEKKRPDDFYQEMLHIEDLLEKRLAPKDSPISLESGVAVMKLLAATQQKRNQTVKIFI